MALLMLALGCGLIASIGITQVLAKRNSEPSAYPGETVPIFIAVKDIPLGDPLTAEVLKLEPWPKDKVPPSALSKISDVEGRRTRQKLFAGEPIIENKILSKGASAQGASAEIPKGYRVVSVKVDSVSGSGLILPGDRVDVLVFLVSNVQRNIHETSTRTVLQDVKVFAVNDMVDSYEDKDSKDKSISAKTISLLVTPAQAAKVTLASEMGKIRLVMRSPEDDTHTEDVSAKPDELFGRSAYSNREKEASGEKNEGTKGLLDYINQMKANMAANQNLPADNSQPTITWTMRILKPNEINDVVLESDARAEEGNSVSSQWRISSGFVPSSGSSKSAQEHASAAKKEVKPSQPKAEPPSTPPSAPPETQPTPSGSSTDPLEADPDQAKIPELYPPH